MESRLSIPAHHELGLADCRAWEAEVLASFSAIETLPELVALPRYRQIYAILAQALPRVRTPPRRLPHERLLAAHFGAARVTIRKALSALAEEGHLERTSGRGTFVVDPTNRAA